MKNSRVFWELHFIARMLEASSIQSRANGISSVRSVPCNSRQAGSEVNGTRGYPGVHCHRTDSLAVWWRESQHLFRPRESFVLNVM